MPRRLLFYRRLLLVSILAVLEVTFAFARDTPGDTGIPASTSILRFQLLGAPPGPIIDSTYPDAKGNRYGFEGGSVVKVGETYHLFVSEMYGEPKSVAMRLGHWSSEDLQHWSRLETVAEVSGPYETDGRDHGSRSSYWAPMPIFDLLEGRWNLFYVAYQYDRGGSEGRVWRAVSLKPGQGGISGPYQDAGVILQRDKDSPSWEGYQGTDSFYPFRVNNRWYGFYGSHVDEPFWRVGLAVAPHLEGPWTRLSEDINPLSIEPTFIENPIVGKIGSLYVAVYDSDIYSPTGAPVGTYSYSDGRYIGYSYSTDGIHWARGGRIAVQPSGAGNWSSDVRTPLCLLPEKDGSFTIIYTAQVKGKEYWAVGSAHVGIVAQP